MKNSVCTLVRNSLPSSQYFKILYVSKNDLEPSKPSAFICSALYGETTKYTKYNRY